MFDFEQIVESVRKDIADNWPKEIQNKFFLTGYDDGNLIKYHHSFGTYIRNKYKLWENKWEPKIVNEVDVSPNHPDAISMRIIKEVWLRGPV